MPADELKSRLLSNWSIVLVSLGTTLLLFHFRSYDDNRTASWAWVFASGDTSFAVLLCLFALVMGYMLSKTGESRERLLLALAVAAVLPLLRMPEIMMDTARYFTYAKYAEVYGIAYLWREWGSAIEPWTDLPLVPLLYGAVFSLLGESRLYVQMLNLLFFTGTVLLASRLARLLFGEGSGFYAGIALLAMPYLLIQVPQMLVDVATMFFLTLAIYATLRALEGGTPLQLLLAGVAVALAFLSKYSTWMMLSVLGIVALLHARRNPGEAVRRLAVIAGIAFAVLLPVVVQKHGVFLEQLQLLRSFQAPGLRRWGESYLSTFFFQVHPFVTLAALGALFLALRERRSEAIIPLFPFLLLFLLDVKRIRYTLPLFPMLAVLAGYALSRLDGEKARLIAGYAAAFSFLLALFAYVPFIESLSVVNLREAGEFLDQLEVEEVEVLTWVPPGMSYNPNITLPLLDLFTSKRLVYEHVEVVPPPREEILRSPIRFTWEYALPEFYLSNSSPEVVVVIQRQYHGAPEKVERRVENLTLIARFNTSTRLFHFRTLIDVYSP
ncbi:MAG: glycosyltransferase family 39 protein [Euryarchaeota archaeon]|nr:glycosyltransferase family 39 protein [Euryarchaeota archaeon]